jgi:hypothetical protein
MFGLQNLFMYFCSTSLDYGLVIISSALFNYLTYNLYSPMCWYSVLLTNQHDPYITQSVRT